jgi:hypothetical protein
MSKQRAAHLLAITGNNFSEILPPEGGWTKLYTACVMRDNGAPGKFYIVEGGNINYLHRDYSIIGLRNYHPALLDLGISQLEKRCASMLKEKADRTKFPNLHYLLMKCHGLY